MSAQGAKRFVVIADTHIAAGADDLFFADRELAGLLRALAGEDAPGTHVVVLGDLLDFSRVAVPERGIERLDTSVVAALIKLELIAQDHAAIFAELRDVLDAGVRISLVPGNHDLELLLPPVWKAFAGLLGGDRDGALDLCPWIFLAPGIVYAEHGHQHHDVNRVPNLLGLRSRDGVPVPPGTALGEFRLARRDGPTVAAVQRLAAQLRNAARDARPPPADHQQTLAEEADGVGLDADVLAALHDLDPDSPARGVMRTVRRLASERFKRAPVPYMQRAMAGVHRVLSATSASVPFYVTGHTHVAADIALAGGARYLNPGTWSILRPRGAHPGYAYVEISAAREALLRAWPS